MDPKISAALGAAAGAALTATAALVVTKIRDSKIRGEIQKLIVEGETLGYSWGWYEALKAHGIVAQDDALAQTEVR